MAIAIIVAVIGVVSAVIVVPMINSRTTVASAVQDAVRAIDTYWSTHWLDSFPSNRHYRSPNLYGANSGLYDSRTGLVPACGSIDTRENTDNAFYCEVNDTLQWDTVYMEHAETFGTELIYQVVAHEWGHAVQHRSNPFVDSELVSDCLAGVAIAGAARDGLITLQPTSQQKFEIFLNHIGDSTVAVLPEDHGLGSQRIAAFNQGRNGGFNGCWPD